MEAKDEKDAAAVAARLTVKSDPSRPSPSQLKHGKVKPMQNGKLERVWDVFLFFLIRCFLTLVGWLVLFRW